MLSSGLPTISVRRVLMSEPLPLLVLALGGHALQRSGDVSLDGERQAVAALAPALARLGDSYRLLVVHGNGPQVGRLLVEADDVIDLDLLTAQTQGELGYLLSEAMPSPCVTVVTRVVVPDVPGPRVKPIGPARVRVASPQPLRVVEAQAIGLLLESHHVVAGGGGGVPLRESGSPANVVVDKDWVALLLARQLGAQLLVFATDVDAVYSGFGTPAAQPLATLSVAAAHQMLDAGLDTGSMAPKLASAAAFTESSGLDSVICAVGEILSAMAGQSGTRVSRSSTG